jgi:DNA-binding NtrC family response regulator
MGIAVPSGGQRGNEVLGVRKVLIIEDDPSVRECYGKLLRKGGYDARLEYCATSVERNLEDYRDASVVILDYRMPGINGLELLRKLRMRKFTAAALLVTASATPEMIQEARRLGVLRVFCKPIAGAELLKAVEEALSTVVPEVTEEKPLAGSERPSPAGKGSPERVFKQRGLT